MQFDDFDARAVSERVRLSGGQVSAIGRRPGRGGASLQVRSGQVWVTQAGDPCDHILGPGERWESHGRGTTVVQALTDAAFDLVGGRGAAASTWLGRLLPRRTFPAAGEECRGGA